MDLSGAGNVFGLNEELQPSLDNMRTRLHDPVIEEGVRDTGGQVTLAIFECKKPIIGAINGAAVGIGATMSCAMDIRLVSESARVGFVFNKIGITPEAASSWFLPRIVNMGTALEWIYSGDLIGAEELTQKGFANHQLAAEELLPKAYEIARRIAQHSQVAIALSRQMMYRNASLSHPLGAHEVDSLAIFYASKSSGKEGVSAFLEKRRPEFADKASTDMPPFYPWW
jgi:enoyl-CoA hydratase/carnithine racemase